MDIEAAIIHGKEDRLSLPVMMSDVAYPNYRSNPLDSYLDIEAVVNAAKELECDAVHLDMVSWQRMHNLSNGLSRKELPSLDHQ